MLCTPYLFSKPWLKEDVLVAGGDGDDLEEAELDFDGTPLTPLDDGEEEAAIAELQAQVQELVAQVGGWRGPLPE